MKPDADVIILGAGIVGLSTAAELARRGATVAVLDPHHPGGRGTRAAAGVAVPSLRLLRDPVLAQFAAAAQGRLDAQVREWSDAGVSYGHGVIRPAWNERERQELTAAADLRPEALGDWLEPDQLRSREPALAGAAVLGGFATGAGHVVDTGRYLELLGERCRSLGVTLALGTPVTGVSDGRPVEVQVPGRRWTAGQVVVAAGAWSGRIPGLPALPVSPLRGQLIELDPGAGPRPSGIISGRTYLCPAPDGRAAIGATEERAGYTEQVTVAGVAYLLGRVVARIPTARGAAIVSLRSGLRAATPDGRPLIGRVPGTSAVWIGSGHGGQGILTGPLTGWMLAGLVCGDNVEVPAGFAPGRGFEPVQAGEPGARADG